MRTKTKMLGLTVLMGFFITILQAQQVRSVGDFNGIKTDAFNVVITQSDANTLKVDAAEKILSQIKTEVKEGVLTVFGEGDIKNDKPVTINIGIRSLTSLNVSGSAEVKTGNQLVCDKIIVESSGAGNIQLAIKASEIIAKVTGAGDVALKGSVQLLDATVTGAGDLNATNLEATKVKAKVMAAGNAKVNAVQSLTADVSGAGSIIYKGSPSERDVNISGAGSVRESKSGTGEETDATEFKLGKKKYMIVGDEHDFFGKKDSVKMYNRKYKHWNGLELGVNGFMDYKNSLDTPDNGSFLELDYAKSYQFGLNLLEKDFHIYKNYLNLIIGFGFDFNHYAFKNNISLNSDTTYLSASNDNVDYKKNNLNVNYIKVPLLLEYNASKDPKNNFHIAGGIEFAYRIHSVTKQKYELNDKHYKIKQSDDYNLAPFRYSGVVRIGYNHVTIFANYGLNRLFEEDKAPQVYPFSLGVTISM